MDIPWGWVLFIGAFILLSKARKTAMTTMDATADEANNFFWLMTKKLYSKVQDWAKKEDKPAEHQEETKSN